MQALIAAAPFVGLIGLGVAGLAVFGRDRQADEHTVADYRPTLAPARHDWPLIDADTSRRRLRPVVLGPGATVTPLPVPWVAPAVDAPAPLFAETFVAQVARRYGDSPADRAARILRELRDEARAELAVAR